MMPPGSRPGMTSLARTPTMRPKTIHPRMPIIPAPPCSPMHEMFQPFASEVQPHRQSDFPGIRRPHVLARVRIHVDTVRVERVDGVGRNELDLIEQVVHLNLNPQIGLRSCMNASTQCEIPV